MRVLSIVRNWWHKATDEAPAEGTEMTVVKKAIRQGVVSVYSHDFGEKEVFLAALERVPQPRMAFINKLWQVLNRMPFTKTYHSNKIKGHCLNVDCKKS